MLATLQQVKYLQYLTDRAEIIKMRHPSLIPQGLMHTKWELGLTTEQAGLRIQMYRTILNKCDRILFPKRIKKIMDMEDLPA